jgi:hypothetical protein
MRRVAENSHPRSTLSVDFRMWGPTPRRESKNTQSLVLHLRALLDEGTSEVQPALG